MSFKKGHPAYNKGSKWAESKKVRHSQDMIERYNNDPIFHEECLERAKKMNISYIEKRKNPEFIKYHRNSCKNSWTPEKRKEYSIAMSGSNNPMSKKNHVYTKEENRRNSDRTKKFWNSLTEEERDNFNKKRLEGLKNLPNNGEKRIIQIIEDLDANFIYSGNGKYWINGLNPDFISSKNKKVIEYFGCWFHGCLQCYPNNLVIDDSDSRYRAFLERGYGCLIIWEHQLKDLEKVKLIIADFVRSN